MEGSTITTGGAAAPAPTDQRSSVRRRWLVVVASLAIGMAVAFGLGSAVKKSSTTTTAAGSVQSPGANGAVTATVTTLGGSVAIPVLKSTPKPKTTSAPASTGGSPTAAQTTPPPQTQASPPPTQASPPQTQAPPPQTTTGVASGGGGSG